MATLSYRDIQAEAGLEDWRVLLGVLRTRFRTPDMTAGAALVAELVELANAADHHPDLVLRYGHVDVDLVSHDAGGLTVKDVAMAREVSAAAARRGLTADPGSLQISELAIDALDIPALLPFWRAVTAYEPDGDDALTDPTGRGPAIWFQQMDAPRHEQRNRPHLDVTVPVDVAEERVAAAVAAGGVLLSAERAPAFWVLADAEGNEVCVCTAAGREG